MAIIDTGRRTEVYRDDGYFMRHCSRGTGRLSASSACARPGLQESVGSEHEY